jgi:signal peptidase II
LGLTARLYPLLTCLLIAGSLLAADVASKSWAESELRRRGARSLLGGRLVLRYQTNSGIAFGLFQESLHPGKRPFLIAYAAAVTAGLAAMLVAVTVRRRPTRPSSLPAWLLPAGLVAMLAGAAGNLRDRITRGAVIDFIDFQLTPSFGWPSFNLADVYLAVGVGLGVVGLLLAQRRATESV